MSSEVSEVPTVSIFSATIWNVRGLRWLENESGSVDVYGAHLPTVGPKKGRSQAFHPHLSSCVVSTVGSWQDRPQDRHSHAHLTFPQLTPDVNKKVQLDATVCRHLFTAQSLYMFRVPLHPSSGVLKTVSATSGIGHDTGTATSFQRGLFSPEQATLEGSSCTSIMTYTRGSRYSF